MEYMMSRVLAYCLEYTEGIAFGEGIGTTGDQAAVLARNMQGALTLWVEVGMPDAEKLHRASKAAERCAIYTHRDAVNIRNNFRGKTIYRSEEITLIAIDRAFLAKLIAKLERRSSFDLSITERQVYLTIGGDTLETRINDETLG
jgi:uncharacterized protein YaeQ